jgi:hypothetical protein
MPDGPDEFTVTGENLHRAQLLTDRFVEMVDIHTTIERERWAYLEERARDIAEGAPIDDVIDDVERLADLVFDRSTVRRRSYSFGLFERDRNGTES